uniref:Uncharacterized protein n=2 Tax=Meloidogyne TaxID=189290 RepID=A0A6V7VY96_MELEN|nr:unnamed protein product [Meloidogyne enterolobii]
MSNHGDFVVIQLSHLRVNHSVNFIDPVSGAHTQTIERTWRSAKARNKKQHGTHRQMLDSYLCEFLWREECKNREIDTFDKILDQIIAFMPPS